MLPCDAPDLRQHHVVPINEAVLVIKTMYIACEAWHHSLLASEDPKYLIRVFCDCLGTCACLQIPQLYFCITGTSGKSCARGMAIHTQHPGFMTWEDNTGSIYFKSWRKYRKTKSVAIYTGGFGQ